MTRSRIVCSCGARLYEPLPKVCPACGGDIVRVRRNVWRPLLSLLFIAALAAACLAYTLWLFS
jgi:hypothetical protein